MTELANSLKTSINLIKNDKVTLSILLGAVLIRILASPFVPLGADESYYFDWSKNIHLSYYDHPPGVSWLAYLGQIIFGENQFGARFGSIFGHLLATVTLVSILSKMKTKITSWDLRFLLMVTSLSPILSLGGFFIMPDAGLIVFLSLLLLKILILFDKSHLGWKDALICGFLWGMAFNFKYHAIAIGGGSLFALLCIRFKQLKTEAPFWVLMILTPIATAAPVFYWNYQNEWVSFLFQTNHGFAKPSFDLKAGLRTLIGQIALLTPLTFWLYIKTFADGTKSKKNFIILMSSAPLGILLFFLSFYKEVLPHWIIPALWLAIPSIVIKLTNSKKSRFFIGNYTYGTILAISIVMIFGVSPLKELLLKSLDGKTGSLAELTIWDYLKEDSEVNDFLSRSTGDCETSIVSLRWFSTSQLAARFDNKVYCADKNHPSYYTFRDKKFPSANCPVIVLGNSKHYEKAYIESLINISESKIISPKYHDDHKYILAKGTWK